MTAAAGDSELLIHECGKLDFMLNLYLINDNPLTILSL
jgi:hypothetical protein